MGVPGSADNADPVESDQVEPVTEPELRFLYKRASPKKPKKSKVRKPAASKPTVTTAPMSDDKSENSSLVGDDDISRMSTGELRDELRANGLDPNTFFDKGIMRR